MKKLMITVLMMAFLPISLFAQDDMYYVPKKGEATKKAVSYKNSPPKIGRDVNVDEYNRRFRSSYDIVGKDSLGNDIIEFSTGNGIYGTDTVFIYKGDDEDFRYSARMGIYDGYAGWYNPWLYPYRSYYYGFYDPSYYGPYPWIWDPWYADLYYGYWGWSPWHYGYIGWPYYSYYGYYGRPYGYYGGGGIVSYNNGGNYASTSPSATPRSYNKGYTVASNGTFGGRVVSNGTFSNNVGSAGSSGSRTSYNRSGAKTSALGGGSRTSSGSNNRTYNPSYSNASARSYSAPSSSSYSGGSYSGGGGSYSSGGGGGSFGGGGSRSGGSGSGGGRGR
ncbi:MAG: hypothetical protein J6Y97_00910 [Prevotella sp.]|nr:hypothetical protein [Prevotella sp.]